MKKALSIILAAVLVLSLAACTSSPQSADQPESGEKTMLEQIKEAGVLRLGTSPDYPPYEFPALIDGSREVVGLDILMAKEICKDLSVELEISELDFDSILMAIDAGQVDIGISGFNPNDERRKVVDFSDIYWEAEYGFLVRAEDADKIVDEASLKGMSIGVQKGTTMEETANGFADVTVSSIIKVPNLVMELKSKNLDTLLLDLPVAQANAKASNGELVVAPFVIPDSAGGNAIAFKKGNDDFVAAVNATIKRLIDSGDMDKFYVQSVSDAEEYGAQ